MNVQKTVGRAVGVVIVIALLASCQPAKDAHQSSSSEVTQPSTSAGEGLCGFISTATVKKVLGGSIESARLDETINEPACYYVSRSNSAYLAMRCTDPAQTLAGLLNGATALQGSAPGAGNVNGLGRHVFVATEDGKCVLDLGVVRADGAGADVTKALAAGLLEAYNTARVHKP
jgi:hypothetical protein